MTYWQKFKQLKKRWPDLSKAELQHILALGLEDPDSIRDTVAKLRGAASLVAAAASLTTEVSIKVNGVVITLIGERSAVIALVEKLL